MYSKHSHTFLSRCEGSRTLYKYLGCVVSRSSIFCVQCYSRQLVPKYQVILQCLFWLCQSPLSLTRGGHWGSPEGGGAGHAEGRPAVAQQRPDPRQPAHKVWRNGTPRSCCERIRRGFKVSSGLDFTGRRLRLNIMPFSVGTKIKM